jgi:hypothetical protein
MRLTILPLAAFTVLTLQLLGADGAFLKVRSTPRCAGVYVDGKYIGPAGRFTVPERYAIEPGSHEITLKEPRYEEFTAKIEAKSGTVKIKARMKKKEEPKGPFGRLRLQGGEAESFWSVAAGDIGPVYLNGQFVGHVDELNNLGGGLLVAAGTYELKVMSQVYGEFTRNVTVEANKLNRVVYGQREK